MPYSLDVNLAPHFPQRNFGEEMDFEPEFRYVSKLKKYRSRRKERKKKDSRLAVIGVGFMC